MSSTNGSTPSTKRTVVEEGTHFQGNLSSTCPIDVRGRVEGDIQAPSLTVSAAGAVHGKAKVGSVRSEGELSGEFEAETIELSGTVKDKTVIRARSLEVKLSSTRGQQVLFGDCELSVGDEPSEHDVVEEPAAQADAVQADVSEPEIAAVNAGEAASETEASAAASDDTANANGESGDPVSPEPEAEVAVANSIHEALAGEAEADADGGKGKGRGKGKGKRKENGTEASSGWSQPPSQPPPAQ